ncbi:hypothetical protein [Streptomyces fractus]|uniref:hypothetical protein n=1 Tax=Streptomyces fractus TaxID=641806 RepID=UPI003CF8AEED
MSVVPDAVTPSATLGTTQAAPGTAAGGVDDPAITPRAGCVDGTAALRHVQQLRTLGPWIPLSSVARAVDMAESTLRDAISRLAGPEHHSSRPPIIRADTAERLLALTSQELEGPLATGRRAQSGQIPVGPLAAHLMKLQAEHPKLALRTIARATQTSDTALSRVLRRADDPCATVDAELAARVLRIGTTVPVPQPRRPSRAPRRDLLDAAPVVAHIDALLGRHTNATLAGVAKAAGVHASSLRALYSAVHEGRTRHVQVSLAGPILALSELPPPAIRLNDPITETGLTRRLRALGVLGWPFAEIHQVCGGPKSTALCRAARTGHITPAIRTAVLTAWQELSHRPGPSDISRARALAAGWAPPLAWDHDDDDRASGHHIDDPDAIPVGIRPADGRTRWVGNLTDDVLRAELDHFALFGITGSAFRARLGVSAQRVLNARAPVSRARSTPAAQPTEQAAAPVSPLDTTVRQLARRQRDLTPPAPGIARTAA